MTTGTTSQVRLSGLPQSLKTAQEAMQLPEVQEMLRRLSEYELGIFMPHMHDVRTGEFQLLPDEVTQVESGLETSFQPAAAIASQAGRFLPVGWVWRAGAAVPSAVCEMDGEQGRGEVDGAVPHKMRKGD